MQVLFKKTAEICDIKKLKTSMANKDFSVTYYQGKTLMTINVKKLKKIASFIKKNAKNRDEKVDNHSITTRNCRNLLPNPRGGSLTPRAEKNSKNDKFSKLEKNCEN